MLTRDHLGTNDACPMSRKLAELVAAGTVPPGGDKVLRALVDARL